MPCEMIGSTGNEDIALEELLSIEGVKRISPVVKFDAEIKFGEYKLNCQVQSVHSSFLDVELTEGAIYNDDSNMPFLLLNKAAAESFSADDNTKVSVVADTNVTMTVNNEETNALICGVFDDEKETPAVYMSYDFAQKTLTQETAIKLLFALSNKGYSEQVAQDLQREGITASYEENDAVRWNMMEQQVWQFILSCIGFLVCTAILFRKQIQAESKSEFQALLISGMTGEDFRGILLMRLVLLYVLCIMTSSLIAILLGMVSYLGIISCFMVALIHYWSMKFKLK